MNKPEGRRVNVAVDSIQERLTSYAIGLNYDGLPPEAVHAAKVRIIDTLGAVIGGFFGEPLRIARNLAAEMPNPGGATVIGTRMKTTPDMAAFVNASSPHYAEMQDVDHWPGGTMEHQVRNPFGHPSDVITPILAVGEQAQVSGRDFITAVVLGYEIVLRVNDVFNNWAFDYTNFVCLATAVGAGKLLALSPDQLSHCIAMAVVPNVSLRQEKENHLSMWKEIASGQAGRAGVFAALLARAGMEGPHLPFEGKAGWCDHVAGERFSLDTMGGNGTPFKILDTLIKNRPGGGSVIAPILAAEKIAPLDNIADVKQITVEVYKKVKERTYTSERLWNPDSRAVANHSVPYVVAATLIEGTVTSSSYDDAHLRNLQLRGLIQKIEVVENEAFRNAYLRLPQEHRARVTVVTGSGERLVGEAGGDNDDLAAHRSDVQIEEKFRGLTEDRLGAERVDAILDRLWHLETLGNVAEIPPAFVLD